MVSPENPRASMANIPKSLSRLPNLQRSFTPLAYKSNSRAYGCTTIESHIKVTSHAYGCSECVHVCGCYSRGFFAGNRAQELFRGSDYS